MAKVAVFPVPTGLEQLHYNLEHNRFFTLMEYTLEHTSTAKIFYLLYTTGQSKH